MCKVFRNTLHVSLFKKDSDIKEIEEYCVHGHDTLKYGTG
jgi:hypothetical protein